MQRRRTPVRAVAFIQGSSDHPALRGQATFVQTYRGVLVTVRVDGLPPEEPCAGGVFALHIHGGTSCTGNATDPFGDAGTHYDPWDCPHPYHAGDLPPLFGNDGFAYLSVLTNRFTVEEIVGKVLVIHRGVDDFTSQPAGNAGAKIGCGRIVTA